MWVWAEISAQAAHASSGVPKEAACNVSVPEATTRHNPSRRAGIRLAASLTKARTGVTPRVPIISALVIKAPTQCERLINSGPETPGKKYLLPPEADDLVWEDRSDHDSHIGLGNMPIDAHLNRGVGQQSTSEFAEPVSPDDPQRSEGPGPPGLVVEDGPAG